MTRRSSGITIVEVLVSIGIIIVLASLILSVYSGAKGKSLETVSASNLRQYHVALHLYQQDHGDFPIGKPYHEELTRYLGGTWLEPPLAKPLSQRRHKFETTYMIHAFRDSRGFSEVVKKCFDERGGDIAIVSDFNWATPEQVALTKGGFILYIRMNGSIGKEAGDFLDRYTRNPSAFPCPGSTSWSNYK